MKSLLFAIAFLVMMVVVSDVVFLHGLTRALITLVLGG